MILLSLTNINLAHIFKIGHPKQTENIFHKILIGNLEIKLVQQD